MMISVLLMLKLFGVQEKRLVGMGLQATSPSVGQTENNKSLLRGENVYWP